MTRFRYRAVNAAGDLIEGEVDGQDQSAVVDQLRRQGHLPLATEPVVAGAEDVGSTVLRWLQPAAVRPRQGRPARGRDDHAPARDHAGRRA